MKGTRTNQSGVLKLIFPRMGGADHEQIVVQQLRTAISIPARFGIVQSPDDFVAESRRRCDEHRSIPEIRAHLTGRGVTVSERTVTNLLDR